MLFVEYPVNLFGSLLKQDVISSACLGYQALLSSYYEY
jgi:hypothetical protein